MKELIPQTTPLANLVTEDGFKIPAPVRKPGAFKPYIKPQITQQQILQQFRLKQALILWQRQAYLQTLLQAYLHKPSMLNEEQLRILAAQPFFRALVLKQAHMAAWSSKLMAQQSEEKAILEEEKDTEDESSQEERIGYYTKEERRKWIAYYKEKVQRWREGKNQPKYKARSKIAKNKRRFRGRFAKLNDVNDDLSNYDSAMMSEAETEISVAPSNLTDVVQAL